MNKLTPEFPDFALEGFAAQQVNGVKMMEICGYIITVLGKGEAFDINLLRRMTDDNEKRTSQLTCLTPIKL